MSTTDTRVVATKSPVRVRASAYVKSSLARADDASGLQSV